MVIKLHEVAELLPFHVNSEVLSSAKPCNFYLAKFTEKKQTWLMQARIFLEHAVDQKK